MCVVTLIILMILGTARALPPNFEDMDLSIDQPVAEKVDINQEDPQSNAIHIGHNNPKDSDIRVVQTNPHNTTIHISLNVGSGSKVYVELSNAVNCQLHVSFNGMKSSSAEIIIDQAFNTSVHLAFQNPVNTPVTVKMDRAAVSLLHVSQNVPNNSPVEVTMADPQNCQIHLSQVVPMFSPLTWDLQGDAEANQIEVSQNSADDNSPLTCNPECPQEEYVYDYQYQDSGNKDNTNHQQEIKENFIDVEAPEDYEEYQDSGNKDNTNHQQEIKENLIDVEAPEEPSNEDVDYEEYQYPQEVESSKPESPRRQIDAPIETQAIQSSSVPSLECPGGDLESCIDVCPGQYGPRVFGFCVKSCGTRCP